MEYFADCADGSGCKLELIVADAEKDAPAVGLIVDVKYVFPVRVDPWIQRALESF